MDGGHGGGGDASQIDEVTHFFQLRNALDYWTSLWQSWQKGDVIIGSRSDKQQWSRAELARCFMLVLFLLVWPDKWREAGQSRAV